MQLREDPETNLETIAPMALFTITISPEAYQLGKPLHDQRYLRKHGTAAYYGHTKEPK
jgi:hypothetical protein